MWTSDEDKLQNIGNTERERYQKQERHRDKISTKTASINKPEIK